MRSRFESLVQDVRFALRGAARQPGFTAVVVGTLALAVGAITAIFSVVSGVVLTPLPYEDPDGIMIVWEENLSRGNLTNVTSPANYHAWMDAESFSEIGAFVPFSATLTGDGEPERVGVVRAASTFFSACWAFRRRPVTPVGLSSGLALPRGAYCSSPQAAKARKRRQRSAI